jgi:GNAT superfamily N-acetyltransferase
MTARIEPATTPEDVALARGLFREYEKSIGVSLCFQDFAEEVARLPGAYAPPDGRLLLAWQGDGLAGCVALRRIGDGVAELKRLYVRLAFRGTGLGRKLASAALEEATAIGYHTVRLDTLATMREAQALYLSMGFREIPAYNEHPVEGTRFLEKRIPG